MIETVNKTDELPDDVTLLKNIINNLKNENIILNETIKIYQFKLFGRKSENLPKIEQPGLFNEAEQEEKNIENETPAEKIKIVYERLKKEAKGHYRLICRELKK